MMFSQIMYLVLHDFDMFIIMFTKAKACDLYTDVANTSCLPPGQVRLSAG